MTIAKFQKTLLDWYKENRRDLPWRKTRDPYKILVSEIMLQQTQIPRVLSKYEEFLSAFPTIEALAKAPDKKLMKIWAGLGYWRRAKYLKQIAKQIMAINSRPWIYNRTPTEFEKLPGIGHYTARALACFAFGSKEAFLDTNIRRVYLLFFFPSTRSARSGQAPRKISDKEILPIAQKAIDALPKEITSREWHYALFDYGALVLKDKSINKRSRHYHTQSKFEGSFRSFRAKAVRFILAHPKNKVPCQELESFLKQTLVDFGSQQLYTPQEVIAALLKDKLIKQSATHYSL